MAALLLAVPFFYVAGRFFFNSPEHTGNYHIINGLKGTILCILSEIYDAYKFRNRKPRRDYPMTCTLCRVDGHLSSYCPGLYLWNRIRNFCICMVVLAIVLALANRADRKYEEKVEEI